MTAIKGTQWQLAVVLLLLGATEAFSEAQRDHRLEQSRVLAAALQAGLEQKLMAAMQDGGPVAAIDVCRSDAPALAAELSSPASSSVARTSLRVRNRDNRASASEAVVLERFETLVRDGVDAESLEDFQPLDDGGAFYMKAIVLRPQCLACHGDSIDASVQRAIDAAYPDDAAVGYAAGDLRGAFVVRWAALGAPD